jgi:hypothetical protein
MGRSWRSARSHCDEFVMPNPLVTDFIGLFKRAKNRRATIFYGATALSSISHGFSTCLSTGFVEKEKKCLRGLEFAIGSYVFDIYASVLYTEFCFASRVVSCHYLLVSDWHWRTKTRVSPSLSSAPLCPRSPSAWGFFCPRVSQRLHPYAGLPIRCVRA